MDQPWWTLPCAAPSEEHRARALARQEQLTKPRGSLGRLESVAVTLAALQHDDRPSVDRAPVLVFAGDHGVATRGVSAYPPEVTVQMLHNFVGGGAAISVLARQLGLPLTVVDVGTLGEDPVPGVLSDKRRHGTSDLTVEPAMTHDDVTHALDAGRRATSTALADGADLLVLGELGIGNTTAASAVAVALLDESPARLVGPGTGLDDEGVRRKAAVIAQALELHAAEVAGADVPALEALRRLGGLEIAALAGAVVAASQQGVPVLVDGLIVSVAALVAVGLNPGCRDWLLFSHRSAEQGHGRVLSALDAQELLQLDLRLGEGSGAALAVPLLRLACALHNEMATFAEASVSDRD